MDYNRSYLVSFGDSTRYRVYFEGTKEEFETSARFKEIKSKVEEFLKETFPTGGYKVVVAVTVANDDHRDYPVLDDAAFPGLLDSVKRQVNVLFEGKELNNNAPFSEV